MKKLKRKFKFKVGDMLIYVGPQSYNLLSESVGSCIREGDIVTVICRGYYNSENEVTYGLKESYTAKANWLYVEKNFILATKKNHIMHALKQ
jgi:hypothetical protein